MNIIEYIKYANSSDASLFERWLVFGLSLGILMGLITLFVGLVAKKRKLAIWGLVAGILAGSTVGFILASPLCIFIIWLMFKPKKDAVLDTIETDEDLEGIELDEEDLNDEVLDENKKN